MRFLAALLDDDSRGAAQKGHHPVGGLRHHQDIPCAEAGSGLFLVVGDTDPGGGGFPADAMAGGKHIPHHVHLNQVGGAGDADRHSCGENHHIPVSQQALCTRGLDRLFEHLLAAVLAFPHQNRGDAPRKGEVVIGAFIGSAGDDRHRRAEAGGHPGGIT